VLTFADAGGDVADKMKWTWKHGAATSTDDLPNPMLSGNDYLVCVYDTVGNGEPTLITDAIAPAVDSGWSAKPTGFLYKTKFPAGGITKLMLKAGAEGRAGLGVTGAGARLGLRLPFAVSPEVVVQIVNPLACWEASYGSPILNSTSVFKAAE
jgi:hypothetical protein